MTEKIAHPPIASHEAWLAARKELLAEEKELTRHRDAVNAKRRRLPMVRIDKPYVFGSPDGSKSLLELFDGRRQLVLYHFMFDPAWEDGCPSCTGFVNQLGNLAYLDGRDTKFALISRAPSAKLERYKAKLGWTLPWYSSFGSSFNYDFHVTFDESVAPFEHNFRTKAELQQLGETRFGAGESQGLSVFFRVDDSVFHSYSTYARGVEGLSNSFALLDTTPYGRQQAFEDSPAGWPQRPTYG
jgi:predicted dithiol-disulfide oxidoreductase (DUF899 family)